jgi:hypothetical protein
MSTSYQAAQEHPPRTGYTWGLASTTTVAATTFPTAWLGSYVTVIADRDSYMLVASTSSLTGTTGVGTGAGVMQLIPSKEPMRFRLDGADSWLYHSAVATSIIRLHRSSTKG